ncbi:MAG: ABC transporter permease [Promethearchaeota archaeon]
MIDLWIIINRFNRQKAHQILTVLGLAFSLMSIFVFTNYSSYYKDSVEDLFPNRDDILIVVEAGVPFFQIIPYGSRLNESLLDNLTSDPRVQYGYSALFLKATDVESDEAFSDTIMGINLTRIENVSGVLNRLLLIQGRFPRPGMKEIVLGIEVGNVAHNINETIKIENENFKVVGLLAPSSILMNHMIVCDLQTVQELFSYQGMVTCIFLNLGWRADPEDVKQDLLSQHENINVVSHDDIKEFSSVILLVTDLSSFIFSVFMTFVSIIFMFLITVKKFQARTKEMHVFRALGVPPERIIMHYLLEMMIVALLGFCAGMLMGFVFYFSFFFLNEVTINYMPLMLNLAINSVDEDLIWQLLAFSLLTTVISVIYPVASSFKVERKTNKKRHSRSA